ncbi:MAG TPA: nucleotidyl transferase AbiEii/AbiGii toxin family protein [Coxiellaceae bacterium]|nr:MAG: hypothetical protein A3E81_04525 [Gammaproteobacteria bacterium RIFCSPHIGHO2_12_FULL_36_30]HLB55979.1 nucleotidyl transferase AbiEii/AbiGii toxin family protein [Coxiellaceae bacterium]
MINPIINAQLKKYKLQKPADEENALKEILQEVALFSLSTTDFFSKALFQGGTALRILHQLPRFSEDLDFILKKPTKNFEWKKYTDEMKKAFSLYGITPEIQDREKAKIAVKKMFLKDNSIGKILELNFQHHAHKKLLIKFEIDTNPPNGSNEERKYLDFPEDYSIAAQDLPSNFAGKCHALLCREYLKGRDWFDFLWYVAQRTTINFVFLKNAFNQNSPWKKQSLSFDKAWLIQALKNKIVTVDWKKAVDEVEQFTGEDQQRGLKLWSDDFFLDRVEKLEKYL